MLFRLLFITIVILYFLQKYYIRQRERDVFVKMVLNGHSSFGNLLLQKWIGLSYENRLTFQKYFNIDRWETRNV